MALGGPNVYKGKSMREAHKHLALTEEHFGAIAKALVETLTEIGTPGELVGVIAAKFVALKDEVLNK